MVDRYTLYGVEVRSDRPLVPGLPSLGWHRTSLDLHAADPTRGRFELGVSQPLFNSHGRELTVRTDRAFDRTVPGQPWCLDVEGVVRFVWISGERLIEYQAHTGFSNDLLAFWFIHIQLPFYLALEEICDFIHAGAVEIDGQPVYFIAPSHGGKSTLVERFIRRGHGLISDDKVATVRSGASYLAVPAHPYHRPYRQPEVLGRLSMGFFCEAKPVCALYFLQKTGGNDKVSIDNISGYEQIDCLYSNYLFDFVFLRPRRLLYLAGLANAVPFYSVQVPWILSRLDETCDVICGHLRALRSQEVRA